MNRIISAAQLRSLIKAGHILDKSVHKTVLVQRGNLVYTDKFSRVLRNNKGQFVLSGYNYDGSDIQFDCL